MNVEKMLEDISNINMSFIEEAKYPKNEKKIFHLSKIGALAACLCMVIGVGSIAYAFSPIDAIKSYFSTQNSTVETLLQNGTQTATDGKITMRVENYIADQDNFVFTISLLGTGNSLTTSDTFETAWITKSGEKISNYNKEFGAYTVGKGWDEAFVAHADSMYEDADATFIAINEVPNEYSIEDLKSVEVRCKGLSFEVAIGDSVVEAYTLSSKNGEGNVSDFRASAIGFSYITDNADSRICIIGADGSHIENDGVTDTDGYYGFWTGHSSIDNTNLYSVHGHWGGEGDIAIGVLDIDKYSGICVDGVDYFFNR